MAKFYIHKNNGGYTLIELVVYLAIFIGISVLVVHSLVTIMKTYASAAAYRQLQSNGQVIMERIIRETRNANSITAGSSVFNTNPGTLVVATTDSGGANHTITFSVSGGAVQINDNGTTSNLSSPTEVTVTSLIFRSITTSNGDGVKIELNLTTSGKYIVSAPFYGTVMLRGNN